MTELVRGHERLVRSLVGQVFGVLFVEDGRRVLPLTEWRVVCFEHLPRRDTTVVVGACDDQEAAEAVELPPRQCTSRDHLRNNLLQSVLTLSRASCARMARIRAVPVRLVGVRRRP